MQRRRTNIFQGKVKLSKIDCWRYENLYRTASLAHDILVGRIPGFARSEDKEALLGSISYDASAAAKNSAQEENGTTCPTIFASE